MAIVTTDNKHYKDIANTIRELDQSSDEIMPEEMADRIFEAGDVRYNLGYGDGNKEGRDQGYEVGYNEGKDEGLDQGRQEQKSIMFGLLSRDFETIEKEYLDGMTYIGGYAFANYGKLKTARIPESVITFRGAAFQHCTALETLELHEKFKHIYASALHGCTNLTKLTIPASVEELSGNSLRIGSADNKATIIMKGMTPPMVSSNTFNKDFLDKIIVPVGCGDVYKSATNFSAFADYIKEDWFYESNATVYENAIFIDEDVCNTARVHRYLIIEAFATSQAEEYITGGDSIATLEEFSLVGVGSVEYGGDISVGYNCIDLYNYYTEEELNSLIGVANHSVSFTYTPDEYFIGAGGMDFHFRYGFSEVMIE